MILTAVISFIVGLAAGCVATCALIFWALGDTVPINRSPVTVDHRATH